MLLTILFTLSLTVQQGTTQPAALPDSTVDPPTPAHTRIRALFANLVEDVTHLPANQNLYLLGIGGGLAADVHSTSLK